MLDVPTPDLLAALRQVHERVATACVAAGRSADGVEVLLATKTQPVPVVHAAIDATRSLHADDRRPVLVGENRVQELTAKVDGLADLGITTHLIGSLQSNKVNATLRALARYPAACIESVDSLGLAERIGSRWSADHARPLDVMVQVNVSGEPTKAGVRPDAAVELAVAVAATAGVRLTGFMTVGANTSDVGEVGAGYALLRSIRDGVVSSSEPGCASATGLSMGMSRDLELAIQHGATRVRVGTAVFGARPPVGR